MEQTIDAVVARMQQRLDELPPGLEHRRIFLRTYQRTTLAAGIAIEQAAFEDPSWVEVWDVAFADLYLTAHDADLASRRDDLASRRDDLGSSGVDLAGVDLAGVDLAGDRAGQPVHVPRPWRLAFGAPPGLPALRHVLLGINAHVNYDLPQALLAVISDDDFADEVLMDRRRRDHERIDAVLASRVAAEDGELAAADRKTLLDRVLTPLNRLGSKRFLREARLKVWHNTMELQRARVAGPEQYAVRLAELELLSAAKIADLLAPGQVVLRLAVAGFGVTLPPA